MGSLHTGCNLPGQILFNGLLLNRQFMSDAYRWLTLLLLLVAPLSLAQQSLISNKLEPIRFQLRWHHQFQFAGYYAAKEKGFYREAGFDVTLVAGAPDRRPVDEVLAGRAQYGEANAELLLERLRGKPLVALAAIYQHSPSILLTLKSAEIKTPQDLIGRRIMSVGSEGGAVFQAMLRAEQIPLEQIEFVESSYQVQDLIDGKTDAFNAYLTNEPFYLEQMGFDYDIINPRDYGVDFYSDILFTSEQEVVNHPERVERFKQATIKGWEYALSHPEEIIQLIREHYTDEKSLNHMRYEALSVQSLIMPQLVEVGYINPQRFERMANVFLELGMVDDIEGLAGFIFAPADEFSDQLYSLLVAVVIFLVTALLVAMTLALFNHRLQREIEQRKTAEEKLKQLTDTDPLTLLLNKKAFSKRYVEEMVRARRYNTPFSILLIDLDKFKRVNDRYGHEVGDQVLADVAGFLSKNSRETDVCGRFGGEEFVLLLPNTPLAESTAYANRLCNRIRGHELSLENGGSVTLTASIGVAEWLPMEDNEVTILRADKALQQAKIKGRDQVVAWSEAP